MNKIAIFDLIEIVSPLITISGCLLSKKKYGADIITNICLYLFALVFLINLRIFYLNLHHRNNIILYTIEHAIILFAFLHVSFILIKKRLKALFLLLGFAFIGILIFQLKNFDPYHSINPLLSAWFTYSMIICGLIIFTFSIKNEENIRKGYEQFSIWFAGGLVLYNVSIFLIYISFDYIQYISQSLFTFFWNIGTCSLLLFSILLFIAFNYKRSYICENDN